MSENGAVVELREAKKYFPVSKGVVLRRVVGWVRAVDGVDLSIGAGTTFSLVGESGCGKTTIAKLILLLEQVTSGSLLFQGKDVTGFHGGQLKRYRAAVGAVFQDPFSSLSPRMRVGEIIGEPLLIASHPSTEHLRQRVQETLEQVGLGVASVNLYPHEFSGGQRQRIAIARALSASPRVIVLDEPVSSLDVSIRAQIMNLLKDIQNETGVGYLLIAHDLGTVRYLSDELGVMYLGKLVEQAPSKEVFVNPLHPYTRALLSAALPSHPDSQKEDIVLQGEIPSPLNPPSGCRFHTRCPQAMPVCSQTEPLFQEAVAGHKVACHLYPTSQP